MVSQLLLLLALSAEPNTATILVRRTAVTPAEANALMQKVTQHLAVPGLLEFSDSQRPDNPTAARAFQQFLDSRIAWSSSSSRTTR